MEPFVVLTMVHAMPTVVQVAIQTVKILEMTSP